MYKRLWACLALYYTASSLERTVRSAEFPKQRSTFMQKDALKTVLVQGTLKPISCIVIIT